MDLLPTSCFRSSRLGWTSPAHPANPLEPPMTPIWSSFAVSERAVVISVCHKCPPARQGGRGGEGVAGKAQIQPRRLSGPVLAAAVARRRRGDAYRAAWQNAWRCLMCLGCLGCFGVPANVREALSMTCGGTAAGGTAAGGRETPGAFHLECSVWNVLFGTFRLERSVWNVLFGTFRLERAVWNVLSILIQSAAGGRGVQDYRITG